MLRNYGQDVPVGARRVASTSYTPDGRRGGLGSVAFVRGCGEISLILYNPTGTPVQAAVGINGEGARWRLVEVPAYGTVSYHRVPDERINDSTVPDDEEFEVYMTPHPEDDRDETDV